MKHLRMKCNISILCLLLELGFALSANIYTDEVLNEFGHLELQLDGQVVHLLNDRNELVEITSDDTAPLGADDADFLDSSIRFYLYTRYNPIVELSTNLSIPDHFDPQKLTFVVTHGWQANSDGPSCVLLRDAYLEYDDVNVIVADWRYIASALYGYAVKHVKDVAEKLSGLLMYLQQYGGLQPSTLTLAGHSLGAHVVGITGHHLNGSVNRIFGLDPAQFLFGSVGAGERLTNEDGQHVQVIHTSMLGFSEALGVADFYPNGGCKQPGCSYLNPTCSHARAYIYLSESINSQTPFCASKCPSIDDFNNCSTVADTLMGRVKSDDCISGIFYLTTNSEPPYAQGQASD